MATKRKASEMAAAVDDDPVDPSDELVFTGLGGCNEVGRSCHILQYKGKTVMVWQFVPRHCLILVLTLRQLDAGMYSGRDGIAALPYFDEFDLSTIDVLLISQYVPFLFLSDGISKPLYFTVAFVAFRQIGVMSQTSKSHLCAEFGCSLSFHVWVKSCTSLDESQYKNLQNSSI